MSAAGPTIARIDPFEELGAVGEIYRAALELEPGRELLWRDGWLRDHAKRADFVVLGAGEDGELVGIAYGFTGAHGQWWTDHVARAMDEETRAAWLDPPHFQVVELHVRPERQRRGIGGALLSELLARQPHERALLTADPAKPQPLPFYTKHGWRDLAEVVYEPGMPPRRVLGKRLGSGKRRR